MMNKKINFGKNGLQSILLINLWSANLWVSTNKTLNKNQNKETNRKLSNSKESMKKISPKLHQSTTKSCKFNDKTFLFLIYIGTTISF
jgi:hypothetical protein